MIIVVETIGEEASKSMSSVRFVQNAKKMLVKTNQAYLAKNMQKHDAKIALDFSTKDDESVTNCKTCEEENDATVKTGRARNDIA